VEQERRNLRIWDLQIRKAKRNGLDGVEQGKQMVSVAAVKRFV
jgi:hypothetical protein